MSEQAYNDRRGAELTELAAFQNALTRLSPTPDGVNIARLLFRAGQLSAPRRNWTWPCATAASMMMAAALGSMLLFRPVPQPAERIVSVYVPTASVPTPHSEPDRPPPDDALVPPPSSLQGGGDNDYLRLRSEVLAHGLDALPPPMMWSTTVPEVGTENLLDLPLDSREPWLLRLKRTLHAGGPS